MEIIGSSIWLAKDRLIADKHRNPQVQGFVRNEHDEDYDDMTIFGIVCSPRD